MVRQISLDAWQIQQLVDLLKKGSEIVAKTNRPIILYRQTLDEEDESYEEIEHESWFLELIYGRPSGHMRRKYAGERPHTGKHSRSLDMA